VGERGGGLVYIQMLVCAAGLGDLVGSFVGRFLQMAERAVHVGV